ncbi:MAG: hypothetical protein QUV10_15575 [Paracoccaceae bacterium]|nr:hypothetical protein [Paracoccaceae bacterium]
MSIAAISQPTLQDDLKNYWALLRDLADADRSGDPVAIWEALDELDLFTLHAKPSPVRKRAASLVASRNFHAARGAAG